MNGKRLLNYFLLCLSILIGSFRVLFAEEYYVTTTPVNQLGNQLFCIATTLAYAWDNDLTPIFPSLNEANKNKPLNREHLFFRLNLFPCPKKITTFYEDTTWTYHPIPAYKDVMLVGWFPCWKYFDHHREKIVEMLSPSDEVVENVYTKYGDLIAQPNTVGIHVRTYSKALHLDGLFFLGMRYFKQAMSHFPDDFIFVVTSDRINWCKVNFTKLFPQKKFVFVEGNNHIEDLFLISKMKHNILSNSTYSFWAAYLNTNPNKIVCVPDTIIRPGLHWPASEFFLPEWIKIPVNPKLECYPLDMEMYDKESASLDEKPR